MDRKVGGKLHQKLNIYEKLIVQKYREGKVKSTLRRELKGTETVVIEVKVAEIW